MAKHDAITGGTGQAGPSLAGGLTAAGMDVAIIERKFFGGTCVNTGCIPTKTLVASAYRRRNWRDMKADKARKDALSGVSKRGVESYLKSLKGCTVYQDHARFIAAKKVLVGDQVLRRVPAFAGLVSCAVSVRAGTSPSRARPA